MYVLRMNHVWVMRAMGMPPWVFYWYTVGVAWVCAIWVCYGSAMLACRGCAIGMGVLNVRYGPATNPPLWVYLRVCP